MSLLTSAATRRRHSPRTIISAGVGRWVQPRECYPWSQQLNEPLADVFRRRGAQLRGPPFSPSVEERKLGLRFHSSLRFNPRNPSSEIMSNATLTAAKPPGNWAQLNKQLAQAKALLRQKRETVADIEDARTIERAKSANDNKPRIPWADVKKELHLD
jgi:hypothetical protein